MNAHSPQVRITGAGSADAEEADADPGGVRVRRLAKRNRPGRFADAAPLTPKPNRERLKSVNAHSHCVRRAGAGWVHVDGSSRARAVSGFAVSQRETDREGPPRRRRSRSGRKATTRF